MKRGRIDRYTALMHKRSVYHELLSGLDEDSEGFCKLSVTQIDDQSLDHGILYEQSLSVFQLTSASSTQGA